MQAPAGSGRIATSERLLCSSACLRIAMLQTAIEKIAARARTRSGIGTNAKDASAAAATPSIPARTRREGPIATGALVAQADDTYKRRNTNVLLVPPNPNAFESAARIAMGRAASGT